MWEEKTDKNKQANFIHAPTHANKAAWRVYISTFIRYPHSSHPGWCQRRPDRELECYSCQLVTKSPSSFLNVSVENTENLNFHPCLAIIRCPSTIPTGWYQRRSNWVVEFCYSPAVAKLLPLPVVPLESKMGRVMTYSDFSQPGGISGGLVWSWNSYTHTQ